MLRTFQMPLVKLHVFFFNKKLGLGINGLVTDRNAKLCCRGFILALFQSTTVNKIDSEHTRDYQRLLPVCDAEIFELR